MKDHQLYKILTLLPVLFLTLALYKVQIIDGVERVLSSQEEDYYSLDQYRSVRKFDIHIHINTNETTFIGQALEDNFQFLDIVDDRPFGLPMDEQQKLALLHLKNYPKLMAFATTFSLKGWTNEDWVENTLSDLESSFSNGAKAVKVWVCWISLAQ